MLDSCNALGLKMRLLVDIVEGVCASVWGTFISKSDVLKGPDDADRQLQCQRTKDSLYRIEFECETR